MSLRKQHLGGLDGIRALAVLSVIAYHLRFSWARGGYLGVDIFFVLSGFLITTLLLEERLETGRVSLLAFWQRRARRLLPALFAMVALVSLFVLLVGRYGNPIDVATVDLNQLRASGFAAFFYYANWHAIAAGNSYFAQFSAPSPLIHTWSLAIEEQFYLVWPLLTVLLLRGGLEKYRRRGAIVSAVIALASMALMAILFNPASSEAINRVYYGTDTRMFDLAVGAAAAWLFVNRPVKEENRRWLGAAGIGALVVVLVAIVVAGNRHGIPDAYMFRGGFLVVSVLTATVLVAVRDVGGLLQRGFALRPLRAVGRVSYGLYLWHWPVIVLVTGQLIGFGGHRLLLVRIALMVALTLFSYYVIEQPIRQRRIGNPARSVYVSLGAVVCVVAMIVSTIPSLSLASTPAVEIARYAPSVPPTGSGDITGSKYVQVPFRDKKGQIERHLRVLVYGDSVPYLAFPGIKAAVANIGAKVRDCAFPGLGIVITNYKKDISGCLRHFAANVVIVTTEWDDPFAAEHPAEYLVQLQRFVDFLENVGVKVIAFESHPVQDLASYAPLTPANLARQRMWHRQRLEWNRLVLQVVRANRGRVVFFRADRSLYLHDRFAWWLPPPRDRAAPVATWDRVRTVDGTHLCPIGAELFGAALAQDLATTLHRKVPHRRWWLDGWQNVKVKFETVITQGCPSDHPPS